LNLLEAYCHRGDARFQVARPGHPCRAFGRPRGSAACIDFDEDSMPSLASLDRLRIARPGHP